MDSKGNVSFVFVFILLTIMVLFMFVLIAPALQVYTIKTFESAEPLLDDANTITNGIQDQAIANSIRGSLQASKDTTTTQVDALSFFYQYAWLFVIGLIALILLLFSRSLVERQVGGAA